MPNEPIDMFAQALADLRTQTDTEFTALREQAARQLNNRLLRTEYRLVAERQASDHIVRSLQTRIEHAEKMLLIQRHMIGALSERED